MTSEEKEIIKDEIKKEKNNQITPPEDITNNVSEFKLENQSIESAKTLDSKSLGKDTEITSDSINHHQQEINSNTEALDTKSEPEKKQQENLQYQKTSQLINKEPSQLTEKEPAQLAKKEPAQLAKKEPTQLTEKGPTQLAEIKEPEAGLSPNIQQPSPNEKTNNIFHKITKVTVNIIFVIIAIILLAFTVFTLTHSNNTIISSGVSILNIDVSGLDREAATDKISNYIQESLSNNDIILKHNDFETNIGPEQIETKVNVANLIDYAFDVGSGNNIFSNSFKKLSLMMNPININPTMTINLEQLETTLNDISTQLPDAVKQSDYYIDNKNLIVTTGKSGVIIDVSTMKDIITSKLNDLSYINSPIEIATISKNPDELNIENIYNEIHKEATDARYDAGTHIVYPEETGLDFTISLDEAKAMLNEPKDEYTIPLKVLYPSVTTNMIGMEAFPDALSSFSTKYPASNRDRTTNLRLAANKVNGTVVLPGQTFSYNSVVGERTIAAGYKEAAIYQDGQVVQRIRRGDMSNIFNII